MRQAGAFIMRHFASRSVNVANTNNARRGINIIHKHNHRNISRGVLSPFASRATSSNGACSSLRNHQSCLFSTTSPNEHEVHGHGHVHGHLNEEVILQRGSSSGPNSNNMNNPHVATLTFNRPKKANAMGKVMLSQLQDVLTHLSSEEGNDVRCVVLTSCSDKVFSAGADLSERSKMSLEEASAFVSSLRNCFTRLSTLPMPLIACVEGAAFGGGLEIALTADMIIAGENARLGLTETSLAIIPGAGGTQRLPRLISPSRAKELIYTARKLDAQTSYEYGIVQHVTPAGGAYDKAMSIAEEVANNGPLAVRASKKSITEGLECNTLTEAMEIEKECYGSIIPTKDRLEGLAAFREKRKPEYKGH